MLLNFREEFESQKKRSKTKQNKTEKRMPSTHWVVTERDFSSFIDVITTRLSLINLHTLITPHFQISSVREKKNRRHLQWKNTSHKSVKSLNKNKIICENTESHWLHSKSFLIFRLMLGVSRPTGRVVHRKHRPFKDEDVTGIWAWWHMPVVSALGRPRWEDSVFEASLGYT